MTIEQQAKELVTKYLVSFPKYVTDYKDAALEQAKQCAIICCETTIKTLREDIRDLDVRGNVLLDLIDRWQQVKNYIETNL